MSATNVIAPPVTGDELRPTIPDRIEDLGIPRSLVSDLILRYLWMHGSGSLGHL